MGIVGGAAALETIEWYEVFWITAPVALALTIIFYFVAPSDCNILATLKKSGCPCCPKNRIGDIYDLPPKPDQGCCAPNANALPSSPPSPAWYYLVYAEAACVALCVTSTLLGLTFGETRGWTDGVAATLVIFGAVFACAFACCAYKNPVALIPIRTFGRTETFLLLASGFNGMSQFALYQTLPYLYTSTLMDFQVRKDIFFPLKKNDNAHLFFLPLSPFFPSPREVF